MRLPATSMDRVGDDGKRGEVENNAIASGKGRAAQWRQASAATRPAVGAGTRRWGRGGPAKGGRGRAERGSPSGSPQQETNRQRPPARARARETRTLLSDRGGNLETQQPKAVWAGAGRCL